MKKLLGTLALCSLIMPAPLVAEKTKKEKLQIAGACKQFANGAADIIAEFASEEGEANEDVFIESFCNLFCGALKLASHATRSHLHRSLNSYTIDELVEFILEDPEIRSALIAHLIKHLQQRKLCTR